MNWYYMFYLVSVADSLRAFFDTFSNIFTWFTVIGAVAYIVFFCMYTNETSENGMDSIDAKSIRAVQSIVNRFFWWSMFACFVSWLGYMAIPSKRDALIIIAGGTVGNFIQNDSSASKVPHEVMNLLRTKIRSEISESNLSLIDADTLKEKSREELVKIIKDSQKE